MQTAFVIRFVLVALAHHVVQFTACAICALRAVLAWRKKRCDFARRRAQRRARIRPVVFHLARRIWIGRTLDVIGRMSVDATDCL